MPDAYKPKLSEFQLTDDEIAAIRVALQYEDPWDHEDDRLATISPHLVSAKDKLIALHMERHNSTCCYCRSVLHGGGRFVRDREHILPKGRYRPLSYEATNLAASCKRCNMEYKGEKVSFVVDPDTIESDHTNSDRYLFIHPNFDNYEDHIMRTSRQFGNKFAVAYSLDPNDPKATFTFDFFGLAKLEKDSFDEVQGLIKAASSEVEKKEDIPERI